MATEAVERRLPRAGLKARRWPSLVSALRRIPRAAFGCALVATLSAACWSVITPPFQAIDEPDHFAYAQELAETGNLPRSSREEYSLEERTVLRDLHQEEIKWHPETRTISSPAAVRQLQADLAAPLTRSGVGDAGLAASEPPLYYALATIPYDLGSSGTLLDRLELMRLLSALMAGVTALCTFLFIRELLPGAPWAWTVGGVAVALAPMVGFTSSVVTPDAMLYAVSAAIFCCLARAFRRGLTRKLAIATGMLTAVGFLTKLNFIGLAPGVMLGLAVVGFRGVRSASVEERSKRAFGSMAIAMGIAVSPVCVFVFSNLLEHHHTLGIVSSAANTASRHGSIFGEVSYIWQFYLPRLPGMTDYFPGLSTARQVWFYRGVGLYGWVDTTFPVWVANLALVPVGLIVILGLRVVVARRAAVWARLPELLVYLTMSVGLMVLVAQSSHLKQSVEAGWAQPRYLVPLLPLAAGVLALAARGAGKRWGPVVGTLIVMLILAQDIFSQLLVVSRFYA
jgi:4-amino-4-deoxy-L-arabinose transferase-like glycosyltransferase